MLETNWELLQFKYEVLGASLEDLARQDPEVSLPVLKYNASNWKQLPLVGGESVNLEGLTSMEDVIIKLGEETSSQTKAFAILKQKFLGPKYVELETVLLHKAIEMAAQLDPEDLKAALTLRSLVTVLNDLLSQNPLLASGESLTEGSESTEWTVTVVEANKSDNDA